MKKTSINLLSILVIALLAVAYILPAINMLTTFVTGFSHERTEQSVEMYASSTPVETALLPSASVLNNPTDSLTFSNGETMPVVYQQAIVMAPDHDFYVKSFICEVVLTVISIVLYCFALWLLGKFVININKSHIFESSNVKILNRFGICMLIIALLDCVSGFVQTQMVETAGLVRQGYDFAAVWEVPWGTFLIGAIALLLGQVWSLGLQMREEQDLTI